MKRKLCLLASFLLLGVWTGYYTDISTAATLWILVAVATIFKCIFSRKLKDLLYVAAALFLIFGSLSVIYRGDVSLNKLYPYIDEYIDIKAEVCERPVFKDDKATFVAKITELYFLDEQIYPNEKVRITWRTVENNLNFGDIFTARIRMDLPSEAENDGAFDYRTYLKTKGIFFSGYIDGDSMKRCGVKEFNISDKIKQFHYKCCDNIDELVASDTAPLLKGVLLGEKSDFDDETKLQLSRSGLSHVTAVSGLHVSTVATIIFALFKLFKIRKRISGVFAIAFIFLFVLISGAPTSAIRAGIMTSMAIISEFIFRKSDAYTSMAFAAIVIVLAWPFAVFDAGFLLSFGAVFGILLFYPRIYRVALFLLPKNKNKALAIINKVLSKPLSIFCTSICVQLTTAPILLYLYQELTFWSLISNLIIIPLMSFVMISGILVCTAGFIAKPIAVYIAGLGYPFLLLLKDTTEFFGRLDFGYISYGHITPFFIFVYILFLSALHLLLGKKYKFMALIPGTTIIALFIVLGIHTATDKTAEVMFINVGQGDSSCISLPRGVDILVDGGGTPSHMDYYDIGIKTVKPYLLKHGVESIEYMIASHGHDDHILGLTTLIDNIKVRELLVPYGFGESDSAKLLLDKANEKNIPVRELSAGEVVNISPDAQLEVLYPSKSVADSLISEQENERSLVMRLVYGKTSILYTGDLGIDSEQQLINGNKQINANILKVAHHGSSKSTSGEFVKLVSPEYAFIPVGENIYGHPDEKVIERLKNENCTVFRADKNNDVIFKIDLNQIISVSD